MNIGKDKEEFLDLSNITRRDNCRYEARISFVLPDGYAGQKSVMLFENMEHGSGDYYFRRDDNYKALKIGESTTLMLEGKALPQNFRMIYFVSTDKVNTMGITSSNNVKVIKNIEAENYYGINHIMTFIDANENLYCWSTAAKNWEVGKELTIKGTIKSLGTYQKQKITYLTRCSEVV